MNTGHFWGNLDKFLLGGFAVYFSMFAYFMLLGHPNGNVFVDAMLDNEKLVLGALLGLITGRALGRMQDNATPAAPKNGGQGDGKQP